MDWVAFVSVELVYVKCSGESVLRGTRRRETGKRPRRAKTAMKNWGLGRIGIKTWGPGREEKSSAGGRRVLLCSALLRRALPGGMLRRFRKTMGGGSSGTEVRQRRVRFLVSAPWLFAGGVWGASCFAVRLCVVCCAGFADLCGPDCWTDSGWAERADGVLEKQVSVLGLVGGRGYHQHLCRSLHRSTLSGC